MSNSTKLTLMVIAFLLVVYAFFAFDIPYRKDDAGTQTSSVSSSSTPLVLDNKVFLDTPINGPISSPVALSGRTIGGWFFEGSFPIQILDASGKVIGYGPGQAQSDWMATGTIPWTASIAFDAGTSTAGYIRFESDDASGIIANEVHVDVPVSFKN